MFARILPASKTGQLIVGPMDQNLLPRVNQSLAVGSPRGNGSLRIPLQFVRFEPYVIPKKSLTGDSTERVDTRVRQVIYRIAAENSSLFVGQQMDVYIEAIGDPRSIRLTPRKNRFEPNALLERKLYHEKSGAPDIWILTPLCLAAMAYEDYFPTAM